MSYITIDKVKELAPFAHLAITTKEVNSKDIQDLRRVFTINNFNLDNLTSNIQIHSDIVHSVNAETIGMKREGVLRHRMINNEGKKIDRITYSILKEEWENY